MRKSRGTEKALSPGHPSDRTKPSAESDADKRSRQFGLLSGSTFRAVSGGSSAPEHLVFSSRPGLKVTAAIECH